MDHHQYSEWSQHVGKKHSSELAEASQLKILSVEAVYEQFERTEKKCANNPLVLICSGFATAGGESFTSTSAVETRMGCFRVELYSVHNPSN